MPRRTREAAQATRTALLDAAERVFERQGVARSSLETIAQEAGVTRGALYGHFRNKVDLFGAMAARVPSPLEVCLDGASAHAGDTGADEDAVAQLLRAVRWALHQIVLDPQVRRVLKIVSFMSEQVDEMAVIRSLMIQDRRDNAQRIAAILERGAAQRGLKLAFPSDVLGRAIYALLVGLAVDWLGDPQFDLEAATISGIVAMLEGAGLEVSPADRG